MSHRRRDTLPRSTRNPTAGKGPVQPRRISRREREAKQRRRLYIGLSVASALVVGILLFSTLNEYVFKPRAVVASVNGVDIRRRDYWKVRSVDLINQINQYQQFAQVVDASQQQQYITLAQQASTDLDGVWGSTKLDETTLNRMVEDQIYVQNMGKLGLQVTDADVQSYIETQFQPQDAPLVSPTPSPTLIPQRAEWATQTVEAESQGIDGTFTPTPAGASPFADPLQGQSPVGSNLATPQPGTLSDAGTPVETLATPVASPSGSPTGDLTTSGAITTPADAVASPTLAPSASPRLEATPSDGGQASPVASPAASPVAADATVAAATPNPEQALQTSEANYKAYQDGVFDRAHLNRDDYERLIVRPAVAREKVRAELTKEVGQTAEQVHAAHILVDTQDLANSIYQSLQEPGANFEQTAIDQSNDTSTAPNGGDLGWFARGQMVDAFEQVAFSLAPGTISEPVKTEFGWHIIKVYEKDSNRALTDQQLDQHRDNIVNDWLAQQRADMKISTDIKPSPTAGVSNFVPPADAPPQPTETAVPAGSPPAEASPDPAGASAAGASSPIAVASPGATGAPAADASPVDETAGVVDTSPAVNGTPAAIASPVPAISPATIATSPAATAAAVASPAEELPASPLASPVINQAIATPTVVASTPIFFATPVIVATPIAAAEASTTNVVTASPVLVAPAFNSPVATAIAPTVVASPAASPAASPVVSAAATPAE